MSVGFGGSVVIHFAFDKEQMLLVKMRSEHLALLGDFSRDVVRELRGQESSSLELAGTASQNEACDTSHQQGFHFALIRR